MRSRFVPKRRPGTRFVTLAGELVDEHGAIAFGPRQSATSLVSRRSQLRAARLDLAVLDQQITDAQRETAHLKREIERHEQALRQLAEAGKSLDQQAAAEQAAVASAVAAAAADASSKTGRRSSRWPTADERCQCDRSRAEAGQPGAGRSPGCRRRDRRPQSPSTTSELAELEPQRQAAAGRRHGRQGRAGPLRAAAGKPAAAADAV